MAALDLVFNILANDRASSVFRNVGRESTTSGRLIAAGIGGAGLAVAAFGASAAKAGMDFDATIRQVAAVAGVPKPQLKELSDLALKFGEDTKFSAGEAADAILELAKGGLTTADIKAGALKETLTLAAAGSIDLASAATAVSNGLNAFGLKAKDAGQVTAALAGAANASSASVDSLQQALAQVGAGARNAGLSVQETTGALAAFANAGLQGSDAGTSLKTFLTTLVPKTTAAYNEFARLGLATFDSAKAMEFLRLRGIQPLGTSQEVLEGQIRKLVAAEKDIKPESAAAGRELEKLAQAGVTTSNAFFDAEGNTKSLSEISGILSKTLGNLSEEEKNRTMATLFGSDATRAATILTREGEAGLEKYIKATSDSTAANKVAAAATEGAKGAVEKFRGSLETLQIRAGLAIAPVVEKLALVGATMLDKVVPAGRKLADMMDPTLRLAFTAVKVAAELVFNILTKLIEVYRNNQTTVNSVAVAVGTLTLVLNASALANGVATVALRAYIAAMAFGIGTLNAIRGAVIAFNLALAANPIGVVTALILALAAGLIYAYKHSETFRKVVDAAFKVVKTQVAAAREAAEKFIDVLESIKVPKALSTIADIVGGIASGIGRAGGGIKDLVAGIGDGPGRPAAGGGGSTLRRVQSMLPAGTYVTSTYRSPAENARVGGSPTSYHMDRNNPAVDIGGSTAQLDRFYRTLRSLGGWRELLWRVPGHYDHIHVAHTGGTVDSSWATMPGLKSNERPVITEVGEVITTAADMGDVLSELRLLRAEFRNQNDRYLQLARTGAF